MENRDSLWDWIIEKGIATEETLKVVTSLNGYTVETLNSIIYVMTGYRDRESYEEK